MNNQALASLPVGVFATTFPLTTSFNTLDLRNTGITCSWAISPSGGAANVGSAQCIDFDDL
jgi:hypothetical protein